jgi:protein-tyrosine-phosphatase
MYTHKHYIATVRTLKENTMDSKLKQFLDTLGEEYPDPLQEPEKDLHLVLEQIHHELKRIADALEKQR